MTIETNICTFQILNTFEVWVNFEGLKIDEFHKTLELSPLYKGKSLADLK